MLYVRFHLCGDLHLKQLKATISLKKHFSKQVVCLDRLPRLLLVDVSDKYKNDLRNGKGKATPTFDEVGPPPWEQMEQ